MKTAIPSKQSDNWQKCPSVCRSGKFFYYNPVSGNRVMQSFQDDTWRGENNNGFCLVTATTAADCMRILGNF
jgi:hypothetical protein